MVAFHQQDKLHQPRIPFSFDTYFFLTTVIIIIIIQLICVYSTNTVTLTSQSIAIFFNQWNCNLLIQITLK